MKFHIFCLIVYTHLILGVASFPRDISEYDRFSQLDSTLGKIDTRIQDLSQNVINLQEKNVELEMTIVTTRKIMENKTLLETFQIVGIVGSKIYLLEIEAINASSRGPMPTRNYTEARKFCNSYGLNLATFKMEREMKILNDFAKLNDWLWPLWVGGIRDPWRSLTRPSYRWQSDRAGQETQVDFTIDPITMDHGDQRNGTLYEDCVIVQFSGFRGNGKFRDEECSKRHTPMCHKHIFSTVSDRRKIRRV